MYIRIQNNSVRYRVSQLESRQLIAGKNLQDKIALSPTHYLTYGITTTTSKNQLRYDNKNNSMTLFINMDSLIKEAEDKPSKKGILFGQKINEEIITLALEIDLKKHGKK